MLKAENQRVFTEKLMSDNERREVNSKRFGLILKILARVNAIKPQGLITMTKLRQS